MLVTFPFVTRRSSLSKIFSARYSEEMTKNLNSHRLRQGSSLTLLDVAKSENESLSQLSTFTVEISCSMETFSNPQIIL